MPKRIPETALYPPVKRFLEARGLVAKGEVRGCDVVAVAPAAPEMPVVVELKRAVTLAAVLQCLDRFAVTDLVYLAVPAEAAERAGRKGIARLFRRLGLGLLAVRTAAPQGEVEVLTEPLATPRRLPRRNAARARAVIAEHMRRQGDPNPGGVRGGSGSSPPIGRRRCAAPPCCTPRPVARRCRCGPCASGRRRRMRGASSTATSMAGSSRPGATSTG